MTEVSRPPEYESTSFFIFSVATILSPSLRRRRSSLQNFRTYQPDHHGFLRMQPVLSLIKHDRSRPVDHVVGDFLAAMRRQAMHHDRTLARILQQRVIDLEPLEVAPALHRLLLAAHR